MSIKVIMGVSIKVSMGVSKRMSIKVSNDQRGDGRVKVRFG